jgi:glycosyltransferase involved in cell wall biosynthesis
MGIDFRVALLGENYQVKPKAFVAAKSRFGEKIVQYGFVESKERLHGLAEKGAVVISTANQENFGIAMVEAMRHGCLPLLPDRLSYPEILPGEFHDAYLYRDEDDLVEKLADDPAASGPFRR